jgi:hypothetical protein
VSRLARVVFVLLVGATFSAFFVAQRLKGSPPVVGSVKVVKFFSPNRDGRRDTEKVSFVLKEADDVTVDIVDEDGGRIKRLATGVGAGAFSPVRLEWDGSTDDGARASDGLYRLRIALRRTGRSVVFPKAILLDTSAPRPVVVRVRPTGLRVTPRGPAIAGPGQRVAVTVRRVSRRRRTRFAVWRTDSGKPQRVAAFESRRKGSRRGIWDGLVDGRPAPTGTYLFVPTVEDRAGNRGSAPVDLPPQAGTIPGRPGVIIRRLAVQAPLEPVRTSSRIEFLVDSRGQSYRWNVRRVGAARRLKKGSAKPGAPLVMRAPNGVSGVYLLEVRRGRFTTRVPFMVQSAERAPILAVLPTISWVGSDTIDDDGDGLPNALSAGATVRYPRPSSGSEGTGLPVGFAEQTAPLLAFLDRSRIRYDVTSDLALADSSDPRPTDREGVLLAGPARWVPRASAARLRRYVQRGGRLASFGEESLRRGVTVQRGRLVRPTQPSTTDAFGARLRPVRRLGRPAALVPLQEDPELGLLEGTSASLDGFRVLEESLPSSRSRLKLRIGVGQDRGEEAPIDAETGAPEAPKPALTGSRLGAGVVIRVGLPEWGRRLRDDADVQQVTRNVADILRRVRPRPRSPLR